MTVLQILGSGVDGGAEAYFVRLTGALQRDGGDQTAAIRAHAGRQAGLERAGVPHRTFKFGGLLDFSTSREIAAYARQHDVSVSVAWMNRAARHSPKGPWARLGRLGNYYSLKYYKDLDALVGITKGICDYLVQGGWPAERVHYVPNFAEAAAVPPLPRSTFDTPEGVPLLLSLGRLHQVKAHDTTMKALQRLPEAWLWIAGSGPLEAELKALAQELGVAGRVRFLGWRDDISALFGAADVCVFPSREEAHGTVVVDAWAHGKPLVVSNSAGPSELVRPGEDALLFPIDDVDALTASIRAVIEDGGLSDRLIEAGRARIEAQFSRAAVTAAWRGLFSQYGRAACAA
ncbi:MAG TPA: glycosyltransferase [Caulobacteraceae bacterium]|nr:glycosyltransferase [Caulobacteraceae bacterium]